MCKSVGRTDSETASVSSIDAFEFSTPEQSSTEAFAVWIRYRLKVFDRDGKLTSNWPVAAYGKSQTTTMGGSAALQRARQDWLRRQGVRTLHTNVDDERTAAWYVRHFGYAKTGERIPKMEPFGRLDRHEWIALRLDL